MSTTSRPSIQDVARLAGVAVGTVSNVLNNPDRVRGETADKVSRAITQLGFIRNDAARQLKAGKSQTIGLVVLDSTNPFFGELSRGAEDRAMEKGMSLILGNSGNYEAREVKYLSLFEEQRMAGVLLSPAGPTASVISALQNKGLKTVLVDRMADTDLCCSVGVDDIAGGRTAASHLLNLGRKRIAFVGGPLSIKQVSDRLVGAREASAAVPGASLKIYESAAMNVLSGRAVGEQIVALPPESRPNAIFAANDLLAVGILQALVFRADIRVPEDIAIIGYDDIDFAEAAIVPLSSIRQPAATIGATAVELLLDEIENPEKHAHRQVMYQPELVIRASSKGA
jgi:LacI family transcriptional regulator